MEDHGGGTPTKVYVKDPLTGEERYWISFWKLVVVLFAILASAVTAMVINSRIADIEMIKQLTDSGMDPTMVACIVVQSDSYRTSPACLLIANKLDLSKVTTIE